MSDDPPRRRRRAAPRPAIEEPARAPADGATAKRRLALPTLPLLAVGLGLMLLAAAWTTRWQPGPPREAEQATRVTLEIPADRQRVINNWERFFACYDLRDPAVIELTLRANQRANGSLDFPGERVLVEFPSAEAKAPPAAASSSEEELVALIRSIQEAAPDRTQCGV